MMMITETLLCGKSNISRSSSIASRHLSDKDSHLDDETSRSTTVISCSSQSTSQFNKARVTRRRKAHSRHAYHQATSETFHTAVV